MTKFWLTTVIKFTIAETFDVKKIAFVAERIRAMQAAGCAFISYGHGSALYFFMAMNDYPAWWNDTWVLRRIDTVGAKKVWTPHNRHYSK